MQPFLSAHQRDRVLQYRLDIAFSVGTEVSLRHLLSEYFHIAKKDGFVLLCYLKRDILTVSGAFLSVSFIAFPLMERDMIGEENLGSHIPVFFCRKPGLYGVSLNTFMRYRRTTDEFPRGQVRQFLHGFIKSGGTSEAAGIRDIQNGAIRFRVKKHDHMTNAHSPEIFRKTDAPVLLQ